MSFLSTLAVQFAQVPDLLRLRPELALTLTIIVVLIFDLITKGRESRHVGMISLIGLAGTMYFLFADAELLHRAIASPDAIFGMVTADGMAVFFKLFATASILAVVLMSLEFRSFRESGFGEYYFILLCTLLGVFFLVSTQNLILLVLSLETLGIGAYCLAGYMKKERRSAEAALKYVVFGSASTGLTLFGISLLYGMTGTVDLTEMAGRLQGALADPTNTFPLGIAMILILVGMSYKISAVPFHFWAPDVYEGAPTPVTAFLAVASKGAGFAALLRILMGTLFVHHDPGLIQRVPFAENVGLLLAVIAAVTMTYGNLAALRQNNVKRMLAYSSIAHAGYVLVGFATMDAPGFRAGVFYLVTYYFMNLAAFGVLIYFSNRTGREDIDGLFGLGWKFPFAGCVMIIALVSLTGLPPTAGFIGKYMLLDAAVKGGFLWLAIVVGLNSVISLFYYFRIGKSLFFLPEGVSPVEHTRQSTPSLTATLAFLGVGTLALFMQFGPLRDTLYQPLPEPRDGGR